jgi:Domain of unknown function (DUF4258)
VSLNDPAKVVVLKPRPEKILARVRELAASSGNIIWTDHIAERMQQRGFDSDAVTRILRTGDIEGEIEGGSSQGDWKVKLTRSMGNGRTAGVVTMVIQDCRLVLLTVEWEDFR